MYACALYTSLDTRVCQASNLRRGANALKSALKSLASYAYLICFSAYLNEVDSLSKRRGDAKDPTESPVVKPQEGKSVLSMKDLSRANLESLRSSMSSQNLSELDKEWLEESDEEGDAEGAPATEQEEGEASSSQSPSKVTAALPPTVLKRSWSERHLGSSPRPRIRFSLSTVCEVTNIVRKSASLAYGCGSC